MNTSEETELRRLCSLLEDINRDAAISDLQREALKKAALAIHLVFRRGLRSELELMYNSLGQPLTKEQQEHLARFEKDI